MAARNNSKVKTQKAKVSAAAVKKPAAKSTKKASAGKTVKSQTIEIKTKAPAKRSYNQYLSKYKKQFIIGASLVVLAVLLVLFAKWFVISLVDKVPVTRYQLYSELDKRYGSQVRDQLITQQLVENEASNRGVSISENEIDQEYKKIEDQVGGAQMLNSLLQQQDISVNDFRNQLKLQLLVKKMFGQNITISDSEVNQYLAQNGQASDSATPATQKDKNQAKETLTQQKIAQNFQTWLAQAKSSRVVNF